ncbi:putative receptor-like protein kinase At3g47110 isoform X1 [Actinidia eriantha]|uniref:putative receptor-like protein kinase At3g47110 isoform X1 n=1 Tax=Actinidia eriantha TaxID=165200 RepID=UPI0025857293|nr:putative receptor-like protein kinase At3g47110 isoform X1 [Actinidia eriantha]
MEKTSFLYLPTLVLARYFLPILALGATNYTTDQSALLAFKAHITYDPNNILAHNWTTATSICQWIGVSCTARHHRVTALNLPNMGFSGTIPPHIGNLSFLAHVNISSNNFYGHIPTEFAHLRRLKVAKFNDNLFSGSLPLRIFDMLSLQLIDFSNNSIIDSLPEDLCSRRLSKLRVLSLSTNEFYGHIPSTLGDCIELQYLGLNENRFNGNVPRGIGNLTMLKGLYLGVNNLEGEIPVEIGNLLSLEVLSIRLAGLTGYIPSSIFNISSLKEIHLRKNNLFGSLPIDICSCLPGLEILSLASNKLMGKIPRDTGNCTFLKRLTLSENKFSGVIPFEIGNLQNLAMLQLSVNNLMGPIPATLFNISSLQLVSLPLNYLSGNLPPNIGLWSPNLLALLLGGNELSGIVPNSISNASMLISIDLGGNRFTGSIPNSLGKLGHLEVLQLLGNKFTSDLELSFLTSLTNCRQLRKLFIQSNPLNGILPRAIGNLSSSMDHIDARYCGIKGNIPLQIGNLSNLAFLRLSGNYLSGFIPITIKVLSKLQVLDLYSNKLQGSIRSSLCSLKNLGSLALDQNRFSGSLPACLGNLSSLRYLRLGFNQLNFSMPRSLCSLKDLLVLNLSSNSLSGKLPSELGNLKVAIQIDLSTNQFSSKIPSAIGGMQNLVQLSLANNKLQGSIPQSFGNLVSLEFLDLSQNDLFGVIPKSLEDLVHLKYFNVSFNRLGGEIPSGGPFANFSNRSFMANEGFCDAPWLHMSMCHNGSLHQSRKRKMLLLAYIVMPIVSIPFAICITIVFIRWLRRREIPSQVNFLAIASHRRIAYHELVRATNAFNQSNLLGKGSFSSVYKGVLSDGTILAVKVFNLQLEGAFKSFDTECEILRNLRHRNLTKVISSCSTPDFKSLVLEYMPNGTLEKWLYCHNYFLNILQRLDLMIDVACALEYLHYGSSIHVVHCDLKPSNVLLDNDMVAHVSDFGIAKFLYVGESIVQTKTIGTLGYIAPEYGMKGIVSTKCDVYSYGILLMETFTRTKPTDAMFDGDLSLKRWVDDSTPNAMIKIVDANLLRANQEHYAANVQCVSSIMELALRCSAESPADRMNVKDALTTLKNIRHQYLKNCQQNRGRFRM